MEFEELDITIGDKLGSGNSKEVFTVVGDESIAVAFQIREESNRFLIQEYGKAIKFQKAIPEGINFPKYLNIGYISDRVGVVMQRSKGRVLYTRETIMSIDLWRSAIRNVAQINRKHIEKLLEDAKILFSLNIIMDISKPDNLLYNSELGFDIIDPAYFEGEKYEFGRPSLSIALIPNIGYKILDEITLEDAKIIIQILQTLIDLGEEIKDNDVIKISRNLVQSIQD